MTLLFGTASDAQIPALGASGAIAAVLGAYFVLYPKSHVLTLVLWFPVRIPAWLYLGGWFLYQFFEGNRSLVHPTGSGGSGVAFFAHVGGFVFGAVVAEVLQHGANHRPGGVTGRNVGLQATGTPLGVERTGRRSSPPTPPTDSHHDRAPTTDRPRCSTPAISCLSCPAPLAPRASNLHRIVPSPRRALLCGASAGKARRLLG